MRHLAELVENVKKVKNIRTFPIQEPPAILRTSESMIEDCLLATEEATVHGIKGFIPLALVDNAELPLPIDYLHDVCLCHTKNQLKLWFEPSHRKELFSCRKKVDKFDRRMKEAKAPAFISRQPQPYKKIKHWKGEFGLALEKNKQIKKRVSSHHYFTTGAEYRSFLLYWGPMVLRDILEDDMYLHFLLLSSAITLLLGLSVTEDDVTLAEEMIYIYLTMYPALYGKPNFTRCGRSKRGH